MSSNSRLKTHNSKLITHNCLCLILLPLVCYAQTAADQPVPRTDHNSVAAHAQLLEKAKKGRIDIYFEGDSITRRWGATDYPELLANWRENFFGWNAANFGWGADTIQNILWRLNNGELDRVNPKVIVLLAGTNNVGRTAPADSDGARISDITKGLKAVLDVMQVKAPKATIIITAIFPRNDNIAVMPTINRINAEIARLADGQKIIFLNINDNPPDKTGNLFHDMMSDAVHATLRGHPALASASKPL